MEFHLRPVVDMQICHCLLIHTVGSFNSMKFFVRTLVEKRLNQGHYLSGQLIFFLFYLWTKGQHLKLVRFSFQDNASNKPKHCHCSKIKSDQISSTPQNSSALLH